MDTNKKAVLFDLDGTLIDSKPGIFNAIDYTMEQLHLPMLSEETKDRFIGPSIGTSFRDVCGFDEETVFCFGTSDTVSLTSDGLAGSSDSVEISAG